jgi:hypothetical protein
MCLYKYLKYKQKYLTLSGGWFKNTSMPNSHLIRISGQNAMAEVLEELVKNNSIDFGTTAFVFDFDRTITNGDLPPPDLCNGCKPNIRGGVRSAKALHAVKQNGGLLCILTARYGSVETMENMNDVLIAMDKFLEPHSISYRDIFNVQDNLSASQTVIEGNPVSNLGNMFACGWNKGTTFDNLIKQRYPSIKTVYFFDDHVYNPVNVVDKLSNNPYVSEVYSFWWDCFEDHIKEKSMSFHPFLDGEMSYGLKYTDCLKRFDIDGETQGERAKQLLDLRKEQRKRLYLNS